MAGKEKLFENQIKKYLQSVGVYPLGTPRCKMQVSPVGYYEKRHGSIFTKSGLPDMHRSLIPKTPRANVPEQQNTLQSRSRAPL